MKPAFVMVGEGQPPTSSFDARGTVWSWFLVRRVGDLSFLPAEG
jgi:hypothetical protein